MATPTVRPQSIPDDLVTLTETIELLKPTPHPVKHKSKLERWIARYHIRVFRTSSGVVQVSFSDMLMAQRDEAIRRGDMT